MEPAVFGISKLGNQFTVVNNGTCDQLWKIGYIGSIFQKTVVFTFPFIGVDDVGQLLEGIKADTKRQHQVQQREMLFHYCIYVFDKEIIVFKVK